MASTTTERVAASEDDDSWLYGDSTTTIAAKTDATETTTDDEIVDLTVTPTVALDADEDLRDAGGSPSINANGGEEPSYATSPPPFMVAEVPCLPDDAVPSTSTSSLRISSAALLGFDIDSKVRDDREAGELSGEEELGAHDDSVVQDREQDVEVSEDSDSDDDDVQVTIGDIKATSPYSYGVAPVNLNIKRGGAYPGGATQASAMGKTKGIDLDSLGNINGVPAYEFNLDTMEDKPWRKPGADITDYFNYGFNEDAWKLYCDKQRKLRVEATSTPTKAVVVTPHSTPKEASPTSPTAASSIVNENSKYATSSALKKAGPPPGRKLAGSIDVIGGTTTTSRRPLSAASPMEGSAIQVMTARKPTFTQDGLQPPPTGFVPPNMNIPPPGMPLPPGLPPLGMPLPGLAVPASFSDHYGPSLPFGRPGFPPPPGAALPTLDRSGPPYDSSYYGPTVPTGPALYNPYESSSESQWEARDRPGSSFSQVTALPPQNWEYGHDHSADRSPTRSEAVEEEHSRRHVSRDHREKGESRTRDRDRERTDRSERGGDRERERSRDRDRERGDRDYDERRDRDRDRERRRDHRDRDKEHRSSKRKHREEEESEHRSSRHKRKRSRRDKDEEGDLVIKEEPETGTDGDAGSTVPDDDRRE